MIHSFDEDYADHFEAEFPLGVISKEEGIDQEISYFMPNAKVACLMTENNFAILIYTYEANLNKRFFYYENNYSIGQQ